MKIKKILIANRGEIALRVISSCVEMGIQTVTIYTDEELGLPHTVESNQAISLGSGTLAETYLNIEKIIGIAKKYSVDAIHPGYGFLSENMQFADSVRAAGIKFIGPSSESIKLMGDKKGSKELIEVIGIPSIPGYHGENQEEQYLYEQAKKIGYPVLIKATAGGGGKGMRVVERDEEFSSALESAKREAKNSFGNDFVLIEKYITSPRHIEVQVLSDQHGNHLHFFERECSIQRRHQKIVEETPSTAVSDQLRRDITNAATKITNHINYEGAGTVEFILDEDGSFYFLEMNTRLQVEHPITEMVCGVDLVKLQIKVANGEKIEISQSDIKQSGHAIEVRLYAEDPDNDFMPSTGKILQVGSPQHPGVRLDCGYVDGNEVSINFDPMVAKLISYSDTREGAISKLVSSLNDVVFLGVKTNRSYLQRVLKSEGFAKGETFTHFVKSFASELLPKDISEEEYAKVIATFLLAGSSEETKVESISNASKVWNDLDGFRNY